jgi:uncharacterized protein (DUF2141 family)
MKSIPNFNVVKKFSLACILLLVFLSYNTKAQDTDLDFDVEITDASSLTTSDGSIMIVVYGNDSGYSFMVYNKEPWLGGQKIAEETKSDRTCTFVNLKAGNYSVCVQNRDKTTRCKNVSIEIK